MNFKYVSMFVYSTALYILYYSNNEHIEIVKKYIVTNFENVYNYVNSKLSTSPMFDDENRMFTSEELKKYMNLENGLYLSILGKVYDVSTGAKFYGPDQGYNGFVGRDASLAFVTGDFSEEGLTDDLSSLSDRQIMSLHEWISFYDKNYIYKGKLLGRYYDKYGNPTAESKEILKKVKHAKESQLKEKQKNIQFPPCNIEWKADFGTRVWCTKNSGGILRDWIGVPRILFESPNSKNNRCACVNLHSKEYRESHGNLREYEGCAQGATSCFIKTT